MAQRRVTGDEGEVAGLTGTSAPAVTIAWVLLACVVVASFAVPHDPLPSAAAEVIIPYLDAGYRFKVVPFDDGAGFEQPSFDDSTFAAGAAGFGTRSGSCPLNNPIDAKTEWPVETDILLRKAFELPRGVTNVRVGIAIDNDVQVFINGQDISGGLQVHEFCATRDSFVFAAPDAMLRLGPNLLAVRGRDRGVFSYLDVRVIADLWACPFSQGFWRTHPLDWPVDSLDLGSESYAREELQSILQTPPRGDASLILSHQLIATKLNLAQGSNPPPVSSALAEADTSLREFAGRLPYGIGPSTAAGKEMVSIAAVLDDYNNGRLGPLC